MAELDLFRFLKENEIEISWSGEMLLAWIIHWNLDDFTKMITGALGDGGIDCRLQDRGTICVDIVPLCDYYGIDPERILPNQDKL